MVPSKQLAKERKELHAAVDRHGGMVYRLAFRVLGNRADAEDVAQEVFLTYLRSRRSSRFRIAELKGWLAVTALNTARNVRRGEKNRRRREEVWAEAALREATKRRGSPGGSSEDGSEEVWEVVGTLPDLLRVPLILHYQEGFKYREIAKALNCPEGTVATRISNAKDRIRIALDRSPKGASGEENGAVRNHERHRASPPSWA